MRIADILNELKKQKVTLNQIYGNELPDRNEMIWDHVPPKDFDLPFEVQTIMPNKLDMLLRSQYGVDHIDELFDLMKPNQKQVVKSYRKDPNLSKSIIVIGNNLILDGNHRALAAVLSKRPINYIDVGDIG